MFALLLVTLAGMSGVARGGDDLGRLFTTPREREQLDVARRGAPADAPAPVAMPQAQPQPPEVANPVTVRGLVKRSGGRSTAWVNDSNTYEGDISSYYRQVDRSGMGEGEVTLRLPDGEASVKMKVGQTYDPASARVRDMGTAPEPTAAPAPVYDEDDEE